MKIWNYNKLILFIIIPLTFSLVGCNSNSDTETTLPVVVNDESNNNPYNQQNLDNTNNDDYEVIGLDCSQSNDNLKYNIKYPEISGLSDNDKQTKINSTLKDEALKVLKYYEDPYGSVDLNIDYKLVLKNPNILSIQYSGIGYVSNAAHPNNLFYTTNINIKTGERLILNDLVNVDKDFANKFLNGDFKALCHEQSEALKHLTNEEIQKYFIEADSLDNIGTDKQSDVFSYFTNDSLGISIGVGHAIGDHAEFEIKYKDLKDNIKTENEVWKYFYTDNEEVLFSFNVADSSKTLSVCTSKTQPDYIIYRFGSDDKVELVFPDNKADSWSKFTYSYNLRGGESGNSGIDSNYLSFENKGYEYQIYQEYTSENNVTNVGIKVTDKTTKKTTDIKGLSNSIKGSLISLRENKKIKTEIR